MISARTCQVHKKLAIFGAALLAVCLLGGLNAAVAQDKGADSAQKQELQQAQQQAEQATAKLREIQKVVVKNDSALEKEQQDLMALQQKKMEQYTSENATKREKIMALLKVRRDKELQQKRQAFNEKLVKAMKKEDPKTEDYIADLRNARKKIMEIRQAQQGGQQKMMPKKQAQ